MKNISSGPVDGKEMSFCFKNNEFIYPVFKLTRTNRYVLWIHFLHYITLALAEDIFFVIYSDRAIKESVYAATVMNSLGKLEEHS